jgi:hypothetical protein
LEDCFVVVCAAPVAVKPIPNAAANKIEILISRFSRERCCQKELSDRIAERVALKGTPADFLSDELWRIEGTAINWALLNDCEKMQFFTRWRARMSDDRVLHGCKLR